MTIPGPTIEAESEEEAADLIDQIDWDAVIAQQYPLGIGVQLDDTDPVRVEVADAGMLSDGSDKS